jgi:hypothetical protein
MSHPEELLAREFNRDELRSVLPKRLNEQYQVILSSLECLEDWYAALLLKMIESVLRVCGDLAVTVEQENALPATAWNARNLLELWIWIEYCSASRKNARRFHEDVLRDVAGMVEAQYKFCELAGIDEPFPPGESPEETLKAVAMKELGVASIDSNYEKVLNAAKAVGLDNVYTVQNRFLSKFAHPTAFLVIGVMPNTKFSGRFQSVTASVGVHWCHQCITSFEKVVTAIPPQKFNS